jgi:hypothetical protein
MVVFWLAFSWFKATTIGRLTNDPETEQVAGVLPSFLLMSASSAIVPVSTMPGWLQPFCVTASAVRALLQRGATHQWIRQSPAWSAGILIIFAVTAGAPTHRPASLNGVTGLTGPGMPGDAHAVSAEAAQTRPPPAGRDQQG